MTDQALAERQEQKNELSKTPLEIGERGLELKNMNDLWRFAGIAAKSGLAPASMNKDPMTIMLALQAGMELRLSPMESLKGIYVVNNRPSVWGDAALAIIRRSGLLEDFHEEIIDEGGVMAGKCLVRRRGDKRDTVRTFSQKDAEEAKLWNKPGPWQQYRKRMLIMRARSWALRDTFPDLLGGFYIAEEAQDIPGRNQAARADVTDVESRPVSKAAGLADRLMQQKPEAEKAENVDFLDADIPNMDEWDNTLLSTPEASELHRDLARNGLESTAHSQYAGAIVERPISSLTELTRAEAKRVFQAAAEAARAAGDEVTA